MRVQGWSTVLIFLLLQTIEPILYYNKLIVLNILLNIISSEVISDRSSKVFFLVFMDYSITTMYVYCILQRYVVHLTLMRMPKSFRPLQSIIKEETLRVMTVLQDERNW